MEFANFITKGIKIEKDEDGDREFIGHVTVEIVDLQNEFVAVGELLKAFIPFMNTHPTISDSHTNRGVGFVKDYELSEYAGHPSVLIKAIIYKEDGVELYDNVWEEIKSGLRKGLSIGGAAKTQTPIIKDGKKIVMLKDLELYEIAVCENPANTLAIIKDVNQFAKSYGDESMIKDNDGRKIIQCTSIMCGFTPIEKKEAEGLEGIFDPPPDFLDPLPLEKGTEYITKPISGHNWDYWEKKLQDQYPDEETKSKVIGAMENKQKEMLENMLDTNYKKLKKLL